MHFHQKPIVRTLDLRAPLEYASMDIDSPFGLDPSLGWMACYTLPGDLGVSVEPDPEAYFGNLLYAGVESEGLDPRGTTAEIPPGVYLFAQSREAVDVEVFFALALEVQREALWRGMAPTERLYLRCLAEEGQSVVQCLRPVVRSVPGAA